MKGFHSLVERLIAKYLQKMFILEILLQWILLTVRYNRNYDQAPMTDLLIVLLILFILWMDRDELKVIGHPSSSNPNFIGHLCLIGSYYALRLGATYNS